ncbi:YdaE family protein [Salmonella enterica]
MPCAYCGKAINKSEIVEHELIYINGSQLARKTNLYCSKRCAEYDQMAHEP